MESRLTRVTVKLKIVVQLADPADIVDDSTIHWPEDRRQLELGELLISSVVANGEAEQPQILFDPILRLDGIEPSNDPLLQPRADVYLRSGRRRRAASLFEAATKLS